MSDNAPASAVKDDPASTIRAAAKLMRERAEAASTSALGRWYVPTTFGTSPQHIADNTTAATVAECHQDPWRWTFAPFIASWDPAVAYAVSGLLSLIADKMDAGGARLAQRKAPGCLPRTVVVLRGGRQHAEWTAAWRLANNYLRGQGGNPRVGAS